MSTPSLAVEPNFRSMSLVASRRAFTIFFTSLSEYSYARRFERLPSLRIASKADCVRPSASRTNFSLLSITSGNAEQSFVEFDALHQRIFTIKSQICSKFHHIFRKYVYLIARNSSHKTIPEHRSLCVAKRPIRARKYTDRNGLH